MERIYTLSVSFPDGSDEQAVADELYEIIGRAVDGDLTHNFQVITFEKGGILGWR